MTDFVTSDLHLSHENIIHYCDRPFASVEEMDAALIQNWNALVAPTDTVYFLGDLIVHKDRAADYYRFVQMLNGVKVLVRGNHDPGDLNVHQLVSGCWDDTFLVFTHNPAHIPDDYPGWVCHGHTHNNTPFIDRDRRRVNVCVEHTGYAPIRVRDVVAMIRDQP